MLVTCSQLKNRDSGQIVNRISPKKQEKETTLI